MTVRFARAFTQIALAFAPFAVVSAQTTTVDVMAQAPYSNFAAMSQTIWDHANLDITNRTRTGFGNSSQLCGNLSLWNAGYSNLPGAAFACADGYVGEFFFQPGAGQQVFLSSLQMGSYFNGPVRNYSLNVYDAGWVQLYTSSGTVSSTLTLNPNVSSNTGLYLQWGTDWDTGLNNITTTVSAEVVATPEPASVVLLATGLVGIVGFARRRRTS